MFFMFYGFLCVLLNCRAEAGNCELKILTSFQNLLRVYGGLWWCVAEEGKKPKLRTRGSHGHHCASTGHFSGLDSHAGRGQSPFVELLTAFRYILCISPENFSTNMCSILDFTIIV